LTDITKIRVTATAETALKKLKKAEIGVYNCKKNGADFIFGVKDKHLKKVFAIFSKPCYNINVYGKSRRRRFLSGMVTRIGLLVGAALFVAAAAISNMFVLKISVEGSGSYLSPEIKRIVAESGAKLNAPLKNFDAPAATGKIMALPNVTFCNIQKRGSVLKIDVRVDSEHGGSAETADLVADRGGVVKNIVAICGTPCVNEGDRVKRGAKLISATAMAGEEQIKSLAVGYVELECKGTTEYFADVESEENLKKAYASVLLSADEIITRTHTVKKADEGVVYVIEFTYLHKLSINMN